MISDLQDSMLFFFGVCTTAAAVVVFLFVRETKGVVMEHVDYVFNGSIWAIKARETRSS